METSSSRNMQLGGECLSKGTHRPVLPHRSALLRVAASDLQNYQRLLACKPVQHKLQHDDGPGFT